MSTSSPKGARNIYELDLHGMKPDVRLRVFDTEEYHVHSVFLKLYSGFFRKFLDSTDKKVPVSAEFVYEWVTQIDEDGSWHLVAAQSLPKKTGNLDDRNVQDAQERAFGRLIQAIYTRPYYICDVDDLVNLVELADYYCSLRIVSRTIEEAIRCGREDFFEDMKNSPCRSLSAAVKLRNIALFRDSLCLSLGPWSLPLYSTYMDAEIQKVCQKAHTEIYAKMGRINQRLLNKLNKLTKDDPSLRDEMLEYSKQASKNASEIKSGNILLPSYYRKLWLFKSSSGKLPFRQVVGNSLNNDLAFARELQSGEGDYEDYFLCSALDEDYPWDDKQEDW